MDTIGGWEDRWIGGVCEEDEGWSKDRTGLEGWRADATSTDRWFLENIKSNRNDEKISFIYEGGG